MKLRIVSVILEWLHLYVSVMLVLFSNTTQLMWYGECQWKARRALLLTSLINDYIKEVTLFFICLWGLSIIIISVCRIFEVVLIYRGVPVWVKEEMSQHWQGSHYDVRQSGVAWHTLKLRTPARWSARWPARLPESKIKKYTACRPVNTCRGVQHSHKDRPWLAVVGRVD